ncbi:MAG: hypothetical protein C4518_17275 [Desulfobacteraceae bacterium]|nr:MAG: hypothetical protein C4518_17275 [Desulfobacteraceae bacterium]
MPARTTPQKDGHMPDMTRFIQSIQRLEGDTDCFGKDTGACNRTDCLWREYCLKELRKDTK